MRQSNYLGITSKSKIKQPKIKKSKQQSPFSRSLPTRSSPRISSQSAINYNYYNRQQ
jgi:hypothetical protein